MNCQIIYKKITILLLQGLSELYHRRALDVTLAAKLTLTYGKY